MLYILMLYNKLCYGYDHEQMSNDFENCRSGHIHVHVQKELTKSTDVPSNRTVKVSLT